VLPQRLEPRAGRRERQAVQGTSLKLDRRDVRAKGDEAAHRAREGEEAILLDPEPQPDRREWRQRPVAAPLAVELPGGQLAADIPPRKEDSPGTDLVDVVERHRWPGAESLDAVRVVEERAARRCRLPCDAALEQLARAAPPHSGGLQLPCRLSATEQSHDQNVGGAQPRLVPEACNLWTGGRGWPPTDVCLVVGPKWAQQPSTRAAAPVVRAANGDWYDEWTVGSRGCGLTDPVCGREAPPSRRTHRRRSVGVCGTRARSWMPPSPSRG